MRVFLSYSHDDDVHKGRVHALADRLKSDPDLQIVLDRDAGPGGPDEGWPAWSERQVRESDRVLIACSRQYALRYEGKDDNSDRGRGTVIEARAIQQFLYDAKGRNARFRVVVFDPADVDYIPYQLRGYHYFTPNDDSSYDEMVAWLKESAREAPAPKGLLWPKPDLEYKLPLADRGPHFEAVRAALSGQSSNRIFLFEGDGASGKTQFLYELGKYAEHIGVPWTLFDFKGARPHEDFFEQVLLDLPYDLLLHTRAAKKTPLLDFVNDLKSLKTPVLLLFDTFEKASEESCSWLETLLLPRVDSLPALVVVIAGRQVPDHTQHPRWRALAEHRVLEPIKNAEDWLDYIARVHNGSLEMREIQTRKTTARIESAFEHDIFLSYAREDKARACELAYELRKQGYRIFWDLRIPPGQTWRSYIWNALLNSKCVIVAWSEQSINSEWVLEEAEEGKRRGILIPVFLDDVEPPFGFRSIQGADLTTWRPGGRSDPFEHLLDVVRGKA